MFYNILTNQSAIPPTDKADSRRRSLTGSLTPSLKALHKAMANAVGPHFVWPNLSRLADSALQPIIHMQSACV